MEVMDNWEYIELSDQEAEAVSGGEDLVSSATVSSDAVYKEALFAVSYLTVGNPPLMPIPPHPHLILSIELDIGLDIESKLLDSFLT